MREQIRLWFYSMLFMSVTLKNQAPYQSVLAFEKLMDESGKPMHKSLGNAIWFDDAAERMGADPMRWLYCAQNVQSNLNFGFGPAEEVKRRLLVLWNVYSFFVTYARIDGFDPKDGVPPLAERSLLDRWIISRLNSVIGEVREGLDRIDAASPTRVGRAVRGRPLHLVRAALAPALLEGRRRRRQAGRPGDPLRGADHADAAARAVPAVRLGGDLPEPGPLGRPVRSRERPPHRLSRG